MITVIYAHPYPKRSRANAALLHAVKGLPNVKVRNLYQLYPDFHIDAAAEQQALLHSDTIVLQHPLQWYHTPALLSLWFEKVLAYGWAYGYDNNGVASQALEGKRLLWSATAGAEQSSYCQQGYNHFHIDQIAVPIQQIALFCGMQWLPSFTVFNANKISDTDLLLEAERYRDRMVSELGEQASDPKPVKGDVHHEN